MRKGGGEDRIDVLVVTEKPGVARAFAQFLAEDGVRAERLGRITVYHFTKGGRKWASVGIRGHLMDFDFPEEYRKWGSVDPKVLFDTEPVRVFRKESLQHLRVLKTLASKASHVMLALDADVEGESIAFEVMDVVRRANPAATFSRAWFNAVTPADITRAAENPGKPRREWAEKAFARMKIDLTIGAAFTRKLTLLVRGLKKGALPRGRFLSYGPCQTPVLYLVVKRAVEREKFRSRKYYDVEIRLGSGEGEFRATYEKAPIEKREDALRVIRDLREAGGEATVVEASYRAAEVTPPPPLNTVEMERAASSYLNIRPKKALDIAENLYQEGIISYPRTDTTIYPPTLDLEGIVKSLAKGVYGEYVRNRILGRPLRPTRGRSDDKAHPPIHPLRYVDRSYLAARMGEDAWRLYDYIVRHFLATLSKPALHETQRIVVKAAGHRFRALGVKVVREGFYEIYAYRRPRERPLPYLVEGDTLRVLGYRLLEKETKPPPFLSESELLAMMRKYGIGTDATMQDHIHTNVERGYFMVVNKRCVPTPLGKAVALALHEHVPDIVVPEVRGRIEAMLAGIAEGRADPTAVVDEARRLFKEFYERLEEAEDRVAEAIVRGLEEMDWGSVDNARRRLAGRRGRWRGASGGRRGRSASRKPSS